MMAMRGVRVMTGLLVITRLVVVCRFVMMAGRSFVMLCCGPMVFRALMLRHISVLSNVGDGGVQDQYTGSPLVLVLCQSCDHCHNASSPKKYSAVTERVGVRTSCYGIDVG